MASSRRSVLVTSPEQANGQAEARRLPRLSPLSSMRWALWMIRSRMASARVGLPTISYQRSIGTWLVIIRELGVVAVLDDLRQVALLFGRECGFRRCRTAIPIEGGR